MSYGDDVTGAGGRRGFDDVPGWTPAGGAFNGSPRGAPPNPWGSGGVPRGVDPFPAGGAWSVPPIVAGSPGFFDAGAGGDPDWGWPEASPAVDSGRPDVGPPP